MSFTFPKVMEVSAVIDAVAAELCPTTIPADLVPVSVAGDGNCFFRAASVLAHGHEDCHLEIRTAVMTELDANADLYAKDFIERAKLATRESETDYRNLVSQTLSDDASEVYSAGLRNSLSVFDAYVAGIKEQARRGRVAGIWCTMLEFGALANVLGRSVKSVYPTEFRFANRVFMGNTYRPWSPSSLAHSSSGSGQDTCMIMWSSTSKPIPGTITQPNHFVPLLQRASSCTSNDVSEWQFPKKRHAFKAPSATSPPSGKRAKQQSLHHFFGAQGRNEPKKTQKKLPTSFPEMSAELPGTSKAEPRGVAPTLQVGTSTVEPASATTVKTPAVLSSAVKTSVSSESVVHTSTSVSGPAEKQVQPPTPSTSSSARSHSRTQPLRQELSNDIGQVILPSMGVEEVRDAVGRLSNDEKHELMFNHQPPPSTLPSTFAHGCNRKFSPEWLLKYPWLRYSPSQDAVFCSACAVMLKPHERAGKGALVNAPFRNWVKLSDVLSNHAKLRYHMNCSADADTLHSTVIAPATRIDVLTDNKIQKRVSENTHILKQIVRAVLYLSKQGLALRGDTEDPTDSSQHNPGNFLALLKVFANDDPILHQHLNQPRMRNATYLSPQSQNEVISIIGCDIIQASLVDEVKKSKFYSILADEVSSHNTEHLALCIRFVDVHCQIREEFVGFVKLERVRASDIASAILTFLSNVGLSLADLRGQGYDGASNMSGEVSGLQRRILDKQPLALYTHCSGHALNLVISKSCTVPLLRNCIATIKSITSWIKFSPKREGLLKKICEKEQQSGGQLRTPLLNVCVTRWVENIDGWERFTQTHPFLVKMCEAMIYGDENYPDFSDWSAEDKRNAMVHLKALESFDFIYSLVTLHRTLLYFREPAIKLQSKSSDIASAVGLMLDCLNEMKSLRSSEDQLGPYSNRVFQHASRIAAKSNIDVALPRISQHQQHRLNLPAPSPEKYFELAILVPFLDHLISEIEARFQPHVKKASLLHGLLPRSISAESSVASLQDGVILYSHDIPNALIVDEEYNRWKQMWQAIPLDERPGSVQETLKACSPDRFPNLFALLKLFGVLPLSSASCERSASTLRRLHTYLRCSQTEDRLSALALVHAHYDIDVSIGQVCQRFMQKHPRRMEISSLLLD